MKTSLLSIPALFLLFVLWMTPGLIGREPWKADEPYSFGLVYNVIRTGDWVVPRLTGEPFLEKPPLYYVTAAEFGRLFSPPLELYDACRLATAFYMLLAFVFFALAAKELYGREHAGLAVVLLLGCVALPESGHKMITDVSLFAGFSIALYGLSLCLRRPTAGGFWFGAGTGIGFLSKGLLAPGVLGLTALALPALFRAWRRKAYFYSLVVAMASALPWLIIWPAALFRRSSDFFIHWFWRENFGRFTGHNYGGSVGFSELAHDAHSFYLVNLIWIAWPVILPAVWSLWHFRRARSEHPAYQVPLVAFIIMLSVLSASSTNRPLYAMPMLLPVALLAVPGAGALPARAKVIANRTSILLWGGIAFLLWFGWLSMMTGSPALIAQKLHRFQPDYAPSANGVLVVAAVLYSLAWLFVVVRVTRSPDFAVTNWTLGVVLAWGLIMTLWLPPLNTGASFRAAFTSLARALPDNYVCLASRGLGESERAMLEYFTGLQTRRIEISGVGNCDLVLEQRGGSASPQAPGPEWKGVWEFSHPSVRPKNIFALYRKAPAQQGPD